jgi:hypothetical protein
VNKLLDEINQYILSDLWPDNQGEYVSGKLTNLVLLKSIDIEPTAHKMCVSEVRLRAAIRTDLAGNQPEPK